MAAGEIEVEIFQVLYQVSQGLTLRPVIGVFLEVANPPVALLPMDVFDCVHEAARSNRKSHDTLNEVYSAAPVAGQPKVTFQLSATFRRTRVSTELDKVPSLLDNVLPSAARNLGKLLPELRLRSVPLAGAEAVRPLSAG